MKVENGTLTVDGKEIISIGDKLCEKMNPKRQFEVTKINLGRIILKKTSVLDFEADELGKSEERQTHRLIAKGLENLKRI